MEASTELVNLYIGVWAETMRGRLAHTIDHRVSRERAQRRNESERSTTRVEEWLDVFDARFGYEASSLAAPYSGPRPHDLVRIVDDPDPRAFAVLTVEIALSKLHPWHIALARHHWILQRGDREFSYPGDPKRGIPKLAMRGRALDDWCKKSRYRAIRPAIRRAISTIPESLAERIADQFAA